MSWIRHLWLKRAGYYVASIAPVVLLFYLPGSLIIFAVYCLVVVLTFFAWGFNRVISRRWISREMLTETIAPLAVVAVMWVVAPQHGTLARVGPIRVTDGRLSELADVMEAQSGLRVVYGTAHAAKRQGLIPAGPDDNVTLSLRRMRLPKLLTSLDKSGQLVVTGRYGVPIFMSLSGKGTARILVIEGWRERDGQGGGESSSGTALDL